VLTVNRKGSFDTSSESEEETPKEIAPPATWEYRKN